MWDDITRKKGGYQFSSFSLSFIFFGMMNIFYVWINMLSGRICRNCIAINAERHEKHANIRNLAYFYASLLRGDLWNMNSEWLRFDGRTRYYDIFKKRDGWYNHVREQQIIFRNAIRFIWKPIWFEKHIIMVGEDIIHILSQVVASFQPTKHRKKYSCSNEFNILLMFYGHIFY